MTEPTPDLPRPDGENETTVFLRRAVEGEDTAVTWLVEHFQPMVESLVRVRLRGQGQAQDVEDLAAEVWFVTLRSLGELKERDGRLVPVLVRYLGTTVVQCCNNFLRRRIRRELHGGDAAKTGWLEQLPQQTRGVVTRAIHGDFESVVRSCMEELSEEDREVLVLRLLEQRGNREIGELLGVPGNTVAVRYRRAMGRLRERLPGDLVEELGGLGEGV